MENLIVNLLSDEALAELKEMERKNQIRILNEEEIKNIKVRREKILKEIDDYTYDSIIKRLKESKS